MLFEYIFTKDLICNDNIFSYAWVGFRIAFLSSQIYMHWKMPLIASNANIDFEAYEDLYKMKTFIGDSLEPMSAESLSFEPLDYDLSLQRSKASEIFNLPILA